MKKLAVLMLGISIFAAGCSNSEENTAEESTDNAAGEERTSTKDGAIFE